MRVEHFVGLAAACALAVGACSSSDSTPTSAARIGPAVQAGKPFPADRCAANKAAGTITYLSGYDFAASASIIDVLVAEQRGYFDDLCLDVVVHAGLASENYAQVAAGTAQFSSGGSFSELVTTESANGDDNLVALAVEGKVSVDTLIVKAGAATTVADLRGSTIGVKGTMTASVRAMLTKAGLTEGNGYTTQALAGFDPLEHIALPGIVGFTGFASNEPGQLDRAGVEYTSFRPAAEGIPGSFGVLYSSRTFMEAHPTAVTDLMRATMHGLSAAIADPGSASMVAIDFIENNGNAGGLSAEGEAFRWQTESKLVADSTPNSEPLGLPDTGLLQEELDAYAAIGLFGGKAPKAGGFADPSVLRSIYDTSGSIIWPTR